MIAYLSGKLVHQSAFLKKDNFVVVEAGGVGYKVFVLDRILNNLKLKCKIDWKNIGSPIEFNWFKSILQFLKRFSKTVGYSASSFNTILYSKSKSFLF